jgi:hypothetical protein
MTGSSLSAIAIPSGSAEAALFRCCQKLKKKLKSLYAVLVCPASGLVGRCCGVRLQYARGCGPRIFSDSGTRGACAQADATLQALPSSAPCKPAHQWGITMHTPVRSAPSPARSCSRLLSHHITRRTCAPRTCHASACAHDSSPIALDAALREAHGGLEPACSRRAALQHTAAAALALVPLASGCLQPGPAAALPLGPLGPVQRVGGDKRTGLTSSQVAVRLRSCLQLRRPLPLLPQPAPCALASVNTFGMTASHLEAACSREMQRAGASVAGLMSAGGAASRPRRRAILRYWRPHQRDLRG